MQVETFEIPGLLLFRPRRFEDQRGWFMESWNRETWDRAAIDALGAPLPAFVQDNHSLSRPPGTLRGLHYQAPPRAQGKLVRCLRGVILDVAVDVRRGSPTFGRHVAVELSAAEGLAFWIPPGFLHGFVTRAPDTEVFYKCTDFYSPEHDGAVRWNSPALAIDWGLSGRAPVLSPKDAAAPRFEDWETPFASKEIA